MNPYSIVHGQIHEQLRDFPDIAAMKVRVLKMERTTDIRNWFDTKDTVATIWIVPGISPESPFANSSDDDSTRAYEIVIHVPDAKVEHLEDIEWQVKRALTGYMEYEDAAGAPLANPSPLKYLSSNLSEFRTSIRGELKKLTSSAIFRVGLTGARDDIRGDAGPAPTVKEILIIYNDSLSVQYAVVYFNQLIEPLDNGDGLFNVRDGLGRKWTADVPFMSPGKNIGIVKLQSPTLESGAAQYTYAQPGFGSGRWSGQNGSDVEDAISQSTTVTVVE